MTSLLKDFWKYVRYSKNYWIIPLVAILLVAGGLLVIAQSSALAPFIYTLF